MISGKYSITYISSMATLNLTPTLFSWSWLLYNFFPVQPLCSLNIIPHLHCPYFQICNLHVCKFLWLECSSTGYLNELFILIIRNRFTCHLLEKVFFFFWSPYQVIILFINIVEFHFTNSHHFIIYFCPSKVCFLKGVMEAETKEQQKVYFIHHHNSSN